MNNSQQKIIPMNIAALREAYINKSLTPETVIEHCLHKINNSKASNAWISVLDKVQLSHYIDNLKHKKIEDSPLWGIPFAIKDNINLKDIATTAACPDFAYTPTEHAFVVKQLINAGAIPLGKTNLDQFATGLVGTRSPYGAVTNSFDPNYISGGSSSGSSFAVATGQVSFALGTDTAGSGRVPAALNNIIGTKPSIGLLSCSGVLPACKSLDCVTFFTTTASDAEIILDVAAVYDEQDAFSRKPSFSKQIVSSKFKIGVPKEASLEFFGHPEYLHLFRESCHQLEQAGAELFTIDLEPFLDVAKLLYSGPWVAERYHAVGAFIDDETNKSDATVATIIKGGSVPTAVDMFGGVYQLKRLKKITDEVLATVDAIVMPTTSNHYTIAELANKPIELNSNMGYYTNFVNLLDYSAVAIPAGFTTKGLPFGVTLFADHLQDKFLQQISQRYFSIKSWGMGATGADMPLNHKSTTTSDHYIEVAVCGAHLSNMPLNHQLLDRNAIFIEASSTSANYQFFALAGGPPMRPGLQRVNSNLHSKDPQGACIFIEIWAVPKEHFGSFVAGIPAPLGIGKLETINGRWLSGFICEDYGLQGATDITKFKDWREYINSLND
jgi:allophanate hydrolase